jgi:hypothetical protein
MIQADERILEHLHESGEATAEQMAAQRGLPESKFVIKERCRVLAQAGYVSYEFLNGTRWFAITSDGVGYLDERMLADEIHPHPSVDWRSFLRPKA